tara:strand:- start:7757 stop:8521 length:765 start_codon:yes stop_codon:yes gene_type:complete
MNKLSIEEIHKKNIGKVSDKWASYLPFYDQLFEKYRKEKLSLLEIGVQNGGSLETWKAYFDKANVLIGCDIDKQCGNLKYDDSRVHVVVGDANQSDTVKKIVNICGNFEIVIDDGSHQTNDIITSFLIYFPLVKPGGLYVIEDTHTLYMNSWGGGILNEFNAYSFFKKLIDVINIQFWKNEISIDVYFRTFFSLNQMPSFIKEGWVESIEFRNSMIIIKKSTIANNNKLGERIITGTDAQVNSLEEARNGEVVK